MVSASANGVCGGPNGRTSRSDVPTSERQTERESGSGDRRTGWSRTGENENEQENEQDQEQE